MQRVAVTEYSHIVYPPFKGIDIRRYLVPHTGYYHTHKLHQIVTVLAGRITFCDAEGVSYECKAGDALLIPSNVSHSWSMGKRTCETLQIYHDSLKIDQYGEIALFFGCANRGMVKYTIGADEFNSLAKRIKSEVTAKAYNGGLLLHARLVELLALITRQSPEGIQPSSRALEIVRESLSYIESNLRHPLTVELLAEHVHLSASRLAHIFKEHTGKSPLRYVNDLKIERACKLMLYSDMNVSQVAEYYGFSSVHYFSRLFKKTCGVNPTEFLSRFRE
ncbi:MAG: helix-turn-helix transcriptional regulator [Planctomycetes bacterium]|nr:helix-turn-helix transcriptional regulator [Planctomycetota bacterium]